MREVDKLTFIKKQLEICYDDYFGDSVEEMEQAFEYLDELIKEKNVTVIGKKESKL